MSDLFIHLRVSTTYSFNSLVGAGDLAKTCAQYKMPAVGRADQNLCNMLEFSKKLCAVGVQPIVGCELSVALQSAHVATENLFGRLLLIVQSACGYRNLLQLITMSYQRSHTTPFVTLEDLEEYNADLLALTGCAQYGVIAISMAHQVSLPAIMGRLRSMYRDRIYAEIQRHSHRRENGRDGHELYVRQVASDYGIPIVGTTNIYFLHEKQALAHAALACIQRKDFLNRSQHVLESSSHCMRDMSYMCRLFGDIPEAAANTVNIARRCSFWPRTAPMRLPQLHASTDDDAEAIVRASHAGLQTKKARILRYTANFDEYEHRLQYELSLINKMCFAGYFLIVSDFVNWAKNNNIAIGPGRGSAAGSLVAWSLGIIDIDPIRFGLLFERFLNPERVSMPDIDIDICQDNRNAVIDYARNKYGARRVANIITFGTLQSRAVIRDVGRVLRLPYGYVDSICRAIPVSTVNPVTLQQVVDNDATMKAMCEQDSYAKEIVDVALELEGIHRHASVHAAGIVINDTDIDETVPLCIDTKTSHYMTQYSMKYVEEAGMIKFDFLGLRTLTVIQQTMRMAKRTTQEVVEIDNYTFDDSKVFELLSKGWSIGIFQLDSMLMQQALQKMQPDCIDDLVALLSLNRPGPIDNLSTYIGRKQKKIPTEYYHKDLEDVLRETFGIPVYQEQVMLMARVIAGYSLASADLLRRAIGKKDRIEMKHQEEQFIEGAVRIGYGKDAALQLFLVIEKFAGYGFNKSHAAAYATISYRTAWLKAHYTCFYIAALMNSELHDTNKLILVVHEARQMGVSIDAPDINTSEVYFSTDGHRVLYALAACKGLGVSVAKAITEERERNGKFNDVDTLLRRLVPTAQLVNKRALTTLIKSGSLDKIITSRESLLEQLDDITRCMHKMEKQNSNNNRQLSLWGAQSSVVMAQNNNVAPHPMSALDLLWHEFEALGLFLQNSPLDYMQGLLQKWNVKDSTSLHDMDTGYSVNIAGVILDVQTKPGKKGKFAKLTILDRDGIFQCHVYSERIFSQYMGQLKSGSVLFAKIDIIQKQDSRLLIVGEILSLRRTFAADEGRTEETTEKASTLVIHVDRQLDVKLLHSTLSHSKSGETTLVKIKVHHNRNKSAVIRLPLTYNVDQEVAASLKAMPGVLGIDHYNCCEANG